MIGQVPKQWWEALADGPEQAKVVIRKYEQSRRARGDNRMEAEILRRTEEARKTKGSFSVGPGGVMGGE